MALSGPDLRRVAWRSETGEEPVPDYTAVPIGETTASVPRPTSTGRAIESPDAAIPTLIPLRVGQERGEDLEDVLLLYDSTQVRSFDTNFCRLAEYYGLLCAKIGLDVTQLTDEHLRDTKGEYFKLVGISADVLLGSQALLTEHELGTIRRAVETGGVSLQVSRMRDDLDPTLLAELTNGAVLGATRLPRSARDWVVSSVAPDMTREFTGQVVASWTTPLDFGLILSREELLTILIASVDSSGATYPVFLRQELGEGSVLIDGAQSGESLAGITLREMYYDDRHFSRIFPLMVALRCTLGDEVWHSDRDYANLTIHGVTLSEPSGNVSFAELLREMEAHDFHTTIALVPAKWKQSEPAVVRLIRANPDRFSLVQHGNNADGYEFYKYAASDDDEYEGRHLSERPLADQEADIVEGMARMEDHRGLTGITHDRVMIFPWGISPEPTLELLKEHNFLATVSAQTVPLGASAPEAWDYAMYQADLEYGNFPVLARRYAATNQPYQTRLQSSIRDLFIDKPALLFQQAGKLFGTGTDAFNSLADQVNQLTGEVEWRGLGYIISHLYLEKRNDDGTFDAKMYGNHLVFSNDSDAERTYHISKWETVNVPIAGLTVNGHEFAYEVEGGLLSLDLRVPPRTSAEILIQYGE